MCFRSGHSCFLYVSHVKSTISYFSGPYQHTQNHTCSRINLGTGKFYRSNLDLPIRRNISIAWRSHNHTSSPEATCGGLKTA